MRYLIYLSSFYFLLIASCTTKTEKKSTLKEMSTDIKTTVKNYKSFPNYSIQLDKGGCRVELLGNDIPLINALEDGGFSSLIPFNANIIKSGKQKLKVKIFPAGGKKTFDEYSRADVTVLLFTNDKIANSGKSTLVHFQIPKEAIEKKLSFFEAELEFNAQVPFDMSEELNDAQQLDKVENIEQKVLSSYNKIRGWLQRGDTSSIAAFRKNSDYKLAKVFYYDTDESLKELFDYSFLLEDEKKLDVMPKYKMVFYGNGKLVRLERIDNKDEVLTVTGKTSDGFETTSDLSVLLYLPKNSQELLQY